MAVRMRVKFDYTPQFPDSDELSLTAGQIVEITGDESEGWLTGMVNGVEGVFPASFVEKISTAPPAPPAPPSFGTKKNMPPLPAAAGAAPSAIVAPPVPQSGDTKTTPLTSSPPVAPVPVTAGSGHIVAPAQPTVGVKSVQLNDTPSRRKKQTLVCLYAHYSAIMSSLFFTFTGMVTLFWGLYGYSPSFVFSDPRKEYEWYDGLVGGYSICAGFGIFLYEIRYGKNRAGVNKIPWRGLIQTLAALPGMVALPTAIGGGMLLIPAIANYYSTYLGESYRAPPPPRPRTTEQKAAAYEEDLTYWTWFLMVVGGKNPDRQFGRVFFLLCYIAANLAAGIIHSIHAYQKIEDTKKWNSENRANPTVPPQPDRDYHTLWIPAAKFFGNILNLNYTFILVPVAHSLMRWIVTKSRARSCGGYFLRAILWVLPVDDAIKIHKMVAYVAFVAVLGHVSCHIMNYVQKAELVMDTFGVGIFITGVILLACIFTMYPATQQDVKRGHFEIFWVTHMLYIVLFITTFIHGRDMFGPNYWKWLIGPGAIYILERIYREIVTRKPVKVMSVTFMSNQVMALVIEKSGPLKEYSEGQYAYISCPALSGLQYHPFTISSAPQEEFVSFHIRIQGKGSWTYRLREFFRVLAAGSNRSTLKLARMEDGQLQAGLIDGPNDVPLLRIHGPYSAPTQHFSDYNDVMICASGIGVTPLASALKSIVHFRWRYSVDRAFPDRATFVWVVAHKEIPSFRWLCRTIKEACDSITNLRATGSENYRRSLKIKIFITSYSQAEAERFARQTEDEVGADDAGLWGLPYGLNDTVNKAKSTLTEMELYRAMMAPQKGSINVGEYVQITLGRPDWPQIFGELQSTTVEKNIGVTFCGNPLIGRDLKANCLTFTLRDNGKVKWHLHKEVF